MERPFSVVAAIIVLILLLLSCVSIALANLTRLPPLMIGIYLLFGSLPTIGLVGILRRGRWARLYNSVLLASLALLASIGVLMAPAGDPKVIAAIPPFLLLGLIFWLALALGFGSRAKKYFGPRDQQVGPPQADA